MPKAVATLAVPTIISQVVTMIYNLADTFFVGQLGGPPPMVAAGVPGVALVQPADSAGQPVRPGRQQPDLPDAGHPRPQGTSSMWQPSAFLRIACLAVPLTSVNFLISYTLQAMGKGVQSAILTFSRRAC